MSSKRTRPGNQQPTPAAPGETPVAAPTPAAPRLQEREVAAPLERVGDVMRRQREKSGYDVYRIADQLCIKPSFLIALENSQYDQFPADAYVIGFLRSYANYLGLDGKQIIDRYRHEMAGRRKKPVLTMPTPVIEGRAPSAIIITGALIAAILVYAIWYGLSSTDRTSVSKPTPLPPAAAIDTTPRNEPSTMSVPSAPAAMSTATTTTSVPAPAAAVASATSAPAPVPATTPAPEAAAPVPAPAAVKTTEPTAATKTAATVIQAAPTPEQAPIVISNGVTIRANAPSWVLITDGSGRSLIDRVLKAGEVYKVPEGKGLSLTTGNSNGLTLSLDGLVLPKLPSPADGSRVLRGISLDPSRLRSMPASSAD